MAKMGEINFTATVDAELNDILLITIGGMMTLASFVGGIVYWNHNRE